MPYQLADDKIRLSNYRYFTGTMKIICFFTIVYESKGSIKLSILIMVSWVRVVSD